ncbi:hypothetical protein MASSI9I_90549 [Massilia sp. 9I]|nr:hypothetical protein MASSI9I_90549 [Massilia sp. 9I]
MPGLGSTVLLLYLRHLYCEDAAECCGSLNAWAGDLPTLRVSWIRRVGGLAAHAVDGRRY